MRTSPTRAVLVAAVALAASACGSSGDKKASAETRTLTVVGTEMAFASPDRVPAGRYDVRFRNAGTTYHELAFKNPSGQFVTRTSIAAGAERPLKVTLSPGRWELGCYEPGHYESGMHKFLVVDPA